MADLVPPHGGSPLRALMLDGDALVAERARAASLRKVPVSSREKGDIIMLGIGGFSPRDGFMSYADWKGVCRDYRTAAGIFWPIPITLSVDADTAEAIRYGDSIALTDPESGEPLATMSVAEKYTIDKALECQSVFRTTDQEHPGVRMVMQQGEVNLAGPITVLSDGGFKAKYGALFMTPASAAITAHSTRITSSTRFRRMHYRYGRSRSIGRSGATSAAAWLLEEPVRTATPTACSSPARSSANGSRRTALSRRNSAGR